MSDNFGFQDMAGWKIGSNAAFDTFRSDKVIADRDGTVFQRLEDLKQTISPLADWILTDKDDFDVADADADTDRWDIGYISGAAGGDADINTTTAGELYLIADYNIGGAERYSVYHATPFYADNFIITEDVSSTFGATDSGTPKAVGWLFSKGTAYDANNYIAIERQVGTGVDRIRVRYNLNGAGEVTDDTAGDITDNAIAFKAERLDQTWRLYYSLTQAPDEEWVLAAQIEDTTDYMTNEITFYHQAFNGAAGDATETAQGDFDFFRYYVGAGGGSQFLVGTYNSDWVTSDIDGNLFERNEAILKSIVAGAAMSIQLNNQTARTNLEEVLEDYFAVWGMAGTDVFDPTVRGVSCTTLELFLDNLGVKLETLQPSANSIDTIYSEVHANLDVASTDSGTTTMDGTEQTVYEETNTIPFLFAGGHIDFSGANFGGGEDTTIKVYIKVKSGGAYAVIYQETFLALALPAQPCVSIPRNTNTDCVPGQFYNIYGIKITATQANIGGGWNSLDMEFFDAKSGN